MQDNKSDVDTITRIRTHHAWKQHTIADISYTSFWSFWNLYWKIQNWQAKPHVKFGFVSFPSSWPKWCPNAKIWCFFLVPQFIRSILKIKVPNFQKIRGVIWNRSNAQEKSISQILFFLQIFKGKQNRILCALLLLQLCMDCYQIWPGYRDPWEVATSKIWCS